MNFLSRQSPVTVLDAPSSAFARPFRFGLGEKMTLQTRIFRAPTSSALFPPRVAKAKGVRARTVSAENGGVEEPATNPNADTPTVHRPSEPSDPRP